MSAVHGSADVGVRATTGPSPPHGTAGGRRPGEVAQRRSPLRAVAIPAEHGGWALTAEPALLGLVVAPSLAGGALAVAAVLAFMARTPLKVALVDRWRGRRLARTMVAERLAAVEITVLAALLIVAFSAAPGTGFWIPLAVGLPLLVVELWFDMRSRGRRLVPELAGSLGIAAIAAAIVLVGGDGAAPGGERNDAVGLAVGLWLVVAARAVASLPFVRLQLARAKGQPHWIAGSDAAQMTALTLGGAAVVVDSRLLAGLAALAVVAALDLVGARRSPPPAVVLGLRQMALGLAVVAVTAAGVHLT